MIKLFCKHEYKPIAKCKSSYCIDYITFSDLGSYEDYLFECKKCGKQKIKTVNCEWELIGDNNES